jgi:hypothetical protein
MRWRASTSREAVMKVAGMAALFPQAGGLGPIRIDGMGPAPRHDMIDDRKAIRSHFENGDHERLDLHCCRLDRTRIALTHLPLWGASA